MKLFNFPLSLSLISCCSMKEIFRAHVYKRMCCNRKVSGNLAASCVWVVFTFFTKATLDISSKLSACDDSNEHEVNNEFFVYVHIAGKLSGNFRVRYLMMFVCLTLVFFSHSRSCSLVSCIFIRIKLFIASC